MWDVDVLLYVALLQEAMHAGSFRNLRSCTTCGCLELGLYRPRFMKSILWLCI